MKSNIITRIAPSPTGEMHIGTVRTALFNYLYAKNHGGTYFVRIEDTDKERNKEEWVEAIWQDFAWCGLVPDARYRTSERLERHKELLASLVASGKAYAATEPKKDDPSQTVEVIRLRNPGTSVTFDDLIRGTVTFDTKELGDFVIARSIDDPLYHFAVVVDDEDARVTHVIRAEEHISNTPRQILILEALGFARPVYAHIPLILAPDRSKLSKRKHGASIKNYRAQGFIPEGMLNYLALLGWNPGGEKELFTLQELVQAFSLERVHKAGAIFDVEKLKWFNHEHLKRLSTDEYARRLQGFTERTVDERLVPLVQERAKTLQEAADLLVEYDFFGEIAPTTGMLTQGGKIIAADASTHLHALHELLSKLSDEHFTAEEVKKTVWPYADAQGRGAVLWPLRVALSGKEKSPDPFTLAHLLGKVAALERIARAADAL